MFNKQNFCHIASNNRNDVKVGVFVYKTTDDLETVTTSGYFNEKIIDINLHDIIIHEWHDPADRTKVEKNILCVTERTLDNVGTTVIKSKWEEDIEEIIESLDDTYLKLDGTNNMTGPLNLKNTANDKVCSIEKYMNSGIKLSCSDYSPAVILSFTALTTAINPSTSGYGDLGAPNLHWGTIFVDKIRSSGANILVPSVNTQDTMALKSQVDLAANSGRMITDQGLWYAKMDSATVAPAAEDGTNYADFSQTNNDGDPIIVIYERQSGAWVQTETITPPADYDGYVPITSKIWDIPEQAGQQGGRILWNHQSKEFTPYPMIVSFEDIEVTGESTVVMPVSPVNGQIVNKQYVDSMIANSGTGRNVGDIFFTSRKDSALNGAVECNGGTYNTGDFSGAQSIGDLLEDGKVPYVSLAQYTTLLNTQGSVGVFGWDGAGTTTFRVPSLEDIFIETGTAAQLGNYIAPGVPNITFASGTEEVCTKTWSDGAMVATQDNSHAEGGGGTVPYGHFDFDASRCSGIYDDNVTTVQPNAVRYRAMVQLAISATDEAVETCTNITAQVAANTSAIAGADYVVESQLPTAQNDYTWYRKYKSGWVEQGGIIAETSTVAQKSIVFPVEMADANYNLQVTLVTDTNSNSPTYYSVGARTKSATGFTCYAAANFTKDWKVCGMAA